MDNEITAGGAIPTNLLFLFTLSAFALMMLLEGLWPRRELERNLFRRWMNNFSLSMLTWYLSAVVSAAFVFYFVERVAVWEIGLLPRLGAGPALSFLALLLVSQLLSYCVHVAFHRVSWLWPIHAIHHSDVNVDVSTSYRHHPLEPLVSLPLLVPPLLLLGVNVEVAMAYKLFEVAVVLFSHSNVRLPETLDRQLRRFILTPDFHHLHHCSEQRYTNSNYGSVVPWFDYLFKTASDRPYEEQADMELGLEYLRTARDSRLDRLLAIPFRWRHYIGPK
ncbi:MAG: sterol desaturase family protein [Pseudomonadales bacterium]|nr:sterol desaturase family protein [Halioglobus sp.]MCP5130005.1 sterol desaturase family protein [Pseudomonadales bacterium]